MKKCLSRWLAALSSLVMLAASAAPAALAAPVAGRAAPALDFSASTAAVTGGIVEFTLDASNIPAEGWNVLELSIEYDDERLTPIDSKTDGSLGWNLGESTSLMSQINLRQSPVLAAAISSDGYNRDGRYLTLAFQMDGVVRPGSWLELEVTLTRCSRMVTREAGDKIYFDHFEDVVAPRTETLSVYVLPPQSDDVELNFVSGRSTVLPGETVQLSAIVAGLDGAFSENPVNVWNVLEYNIEYDADMLTPVQQATSTGRPMDYGRGDALVEPMPTIEVNLNTNPVLVGAIEAEGQYGNGEIMNIAFEVADDVQAGDTITLTVNVSQFAKAVIVDNKPQAPVDLVNPGSYTVTLTVGEPQPAVESIAVTRQPDKTVYQQGEALDLTGMEITAFYSDDTTKVMAVTPDMVSGYDPQKIGAQPLTVTYEGKTTTFVVTVEEPVVPVSIAVTKQPAKTVYRWGEMLDLTGMEITAFYSDNATQKVPVTSDMVSGYNPYKAGPQSLTVTYEGKTTTFVVTVEEQVIPVSIAVTSRPDKTDYQWGEALDLTGMEITVYYSDDTTKVVPVTSDMVSGYDPYNAGQQTLTVSCEGQITTFVVTVNEPVVLESIAVTKQPDKTAYLRGEALDLMGMEITAFYSDDSSKAVPVTLAMVSGYDPQKIGQQPLTVTYEGKTTTFVVTVNEPVVLESIAVTKQPDKTSYLQGEALDLTGMEITVFYSDDTTETMAVTSDMVSGYNPQQLGTQALLVTYESKTTTFVVTVNEPVVLESIQLDTTAATVEYIVGDELDLTGLVVTATYSDDSTAPVDVTPAMVTGFDNTQTGEQTLTVTYEGETATFEVTVYKLGDVNLDGEVKSEDALMALQAATQKIDLDEAAALAANVNGDGEITSADALQILQYATQKIDSFTGAA